MTARHMPVDEAARRIASGNVLVVDVRDALSFRAGHIPGARPLTNDNIAAFLADTPRDLPVIVCCYHGNSSVGVARFLADQGFGEACSLDGGYEAWRLNHPVEA